MNTFRDFKYPHLIFGLLLINIVLVIYSCSGSHESDFTTPAILPDSADSLTGTDKIPVLVSSSQDNRIISGTGMLGLFNVKLTTDPASADVSPVRAGNAIGDPHNVDITGFMQNTLGKNCFSVKSVEYSEDEILSMTFRVAHPFDMPVNEPPLQSDRFDLHVFDLMAIVFFEDNASEITSYSGVSAQLATSGGPSMLSSDNSGFWAFEEWDGFTSEFDTQIDNFYPTQASIHPYKLLSPDSSRGNVNAYSQNGFSDIKNPSGHNVFAQGANFDTTFNLNIPPGSSMNFVMALTASYGQSSRGKGLIAGQRANPRYFLPEFNRKNAWKVEIEIPPETDSLDSNDQDASTVLNVKVWDWQHNYGYPMDDIDPLNDRLDALKHHSRVVSCIADVPGVNELDSETSPVFGNGFGTTPLIYQIVIKNDLGAQEGSYQGLVAVVDELHGTNISDYGVERDGVTTFDVSDFVTYAPFMVDVIDRAGEGFNVNMSMTGPGGDDEGNSGIMLDSSDGKSIAAYGDNIYVVYSAYDASGGNEWDVYLSHSDDHGATWKPSNRLNSSIIENQLGASIAVEQASGDVYVAFTDESGFDQMSFLSDVLLVQVGKNGYPIGSPVLLNSSRIGNQGRVTLAVDENGLLFAAWQTNGGGINFTLREKMIISPDKQILPQMTGVPVLQDPLIIVDTNPDSPFRGTKYMFYRMERTSLPDILCSRYDESTGKFGSDTLVSNEMNGNAFKHRVTIDRHGRIFVSYLEQNENGLSVRVSRSTDGGINWTHTGRISSIIDGTYPKSPAIITRPNNNFIYMFWSDVVNDDRNIYCIRSIDGIHYGKAFKINRDQGTAIQESPSATVTDSGNLYLTWLDTRNSAAGEVFFSSGRS